MSEQHINTITTPPTPLTPSTPSTSPNPTSLSAASQPNTTTNQYDIIFYYIDAGITTASENQPSRPVEINWDNITSQINNLDRATDRLLDNNTNKIWCENDDQTPTETRKKFKVAYIKNNGLDRVFSNGLLGPLPIGEEDGIFCGTHMIIFTDYNIIGQLKIHQAPYVGTFIRYINQKINKRAAGLPRSLKSSIAVSKDTIEKIESAQYLKSFELSVRSNKAKILEDLMNVEDLEEALNLHTQIQSDEGPKYKVHFGISGMDRTSNPGIFQKIVNYFKQDQEDDNSVSSAKVTIVNHDGEKENINLLRNRMIQTRGVITYDESRAIDSESAYRAIESAFDELNEQQLFSGHGVNIQEANE